MTSRSRPFIAIVGGGPAGLAAAETLAGAGYSVTVYERMPSPARKFLLAGRGGLNLTHSEETDTFLSRYRPCSDLLTEAVRRYPPQALRAWSAGLGQETFTGSSGRVFPRSFKATPLLRAWLARLREAGVHFAFRHLWTGWDENGLLSFRTPDGVACIRADATLLALGGASWPRLGSNASWVNILTAKGVAVTPLKPANVGFLASWSEHFRDRFEGTPLKQIAVTHKDRSIHGEAVITRNGIEGGVIYALGRQIRDDLLENGRAILGIDLKPNLTEAALTARLERDRNGQSLSNFLRKTAGLAPAATGLLREITDGAIPADPQALAALIKNVPLPLNGIAPIERAISTAGGVAFETIDETFMLRGLPGTFLAGEMLDWEAPTGGYLLQACFATGVAAAEGISAWLKKER